MRFVGLVVEEEEDDEVSLLLVEEVCDVEGFIVSNETESRSPLTREDGVVLSDVVDNADGEEKEDG
jgi:hypothetical protein